MHMVVEKASTQHGCACQTFCVPTDSCCSGGGCRYLRSPTNCLLIDCLMGSSGSAYTYSSVPLVSGTDVYVSFIIMR